MSFKFDGSLLTSDRTLVDAQVLGDMGLVDGSLTVVDTSVGTVQIDNDSIELQGVLAWNDTTGFYGVSVTRQDGQIIQWKFKDIGVLQDCVVGLFNGASIALANRLHNFNYETSGNNYFQNVDDGLANIQLSSRSAGGEVIHTLVLDDTNGLVFVYEGSTLLFIATTAQTGAVTLAAQKNSSANVSRVYGIKIPDTLQPALVTPQFEQLFANSDGSGATGGETSDPAASADVQITGGSMTGVASPAARNAAGNDLTHTLTNPISNGVVVSVEMTNPMNGIGEGTILFVEDSTGNTICSLAVAWTTAYRADVYDKSSNNVATIYTSGTVKLSSPSIWQINVDLSAKTVSIFNDTYTLTNNTGIDISDTGGMVSTDVGEIVTRINSDTSLNSGTAIKQDNLKVYPRTRTITV